MKYLQQKLYQYDIVFGILSLILGGFLYVLYEWTGHHSFIGLITPVNGSTWEQLKLLFFPILLFSILEYCLIGHHFSAFITARTIGSLSGLFAAVILYYTYTGILGVAYLWLNAGVFFFSTALCYLVTWHYIAKRKTGNIYTNLLCICFLIGVVYVFIRFTHKPPSMNLFHSTDAKFVIHMRP